MKTFAVIADITTSEHFEVEARDEDHARSLAVQSLEREGHDTDDIEISECHEVTSSDCSHCGEAIREDDNGAGVPIWVHEHGSTVCHDVPAGSVADGTTATPA